MNDLFSEAGETFNQYFDNQTGEGANTNEFNTQKIKDLEASRLMREKLTTWSIRLVSALVLAAIAIAVIRTFKK